jgi:hypothetical protein
VGVYSSGRTGEETGFASGAGTDGCMKQRTDDALKKAFRVGAEKMQGELPEDVCRKRKKNE